MSNTHGKSVKSIHNALGQLDGMKQVYIAHRA